MTNLALWDSSFRYGEAGFARNVNMPGTNGPGLCSDGADWAGDLFSGQVGLQDMSGPIGIVDAP